MVIHMPPERKETNEKRLIRWLLTATVVLLAAVLGLQLWQIFGGKAQTPPPAQQAGAMPQSTETRDAPDASNKKDTIEAVLLQNSSLSAGSLEELSREELVQLLQTGAPGLPIGFSAAAEAVEKYAGTWETNAVTWEAEPELDETPAHYEVELRHPTLGEFNYKVDAYTGEVLEGTPDILQVYAAAPDAGMPSAPSEGEDQTASPVPSEGKTPGESAPSSAPAGNPAPSQSAGQTALIGEAEAERAALADAGLQESGTVYCNAWLEYDDGRPEHYEVEFATAERRYEYEIGLYDGAVLKREEKVLSHVSAAASAAGGGGTLIGEAAAKSAAYAHAGVQEADAVKVKCKLDWEDGVQVYEVEFEVGRMEYDYEINAATGAVLKAEMDD